MLKLRYAAGHLGVSQSSLRRWIKDGRIKAIKIGRQWLVSENEIRLILKQGLRPLDLTAAPFGGRDGVFHKEAVALIPSAPHGATCHYERRADGVYIVWGADFPGDAPGSRRLSTDEADMVIKEGLLSPE